MQNLFQQALNNDLIRPCAEELFSLWLSSGSPEPPSGPSTDFQGAPRFLATDELEGYSPEAAEQAAERYNTALEALLALSDVRHIGSELWNTSWEPGTPEWQAYREQSLSLAYEFVANHLWGRFCDNQ